MRLVILVCHLGLILKTDAQIPEACILSDTNRPPENTDITVTCGTQYMGLSIYICPVYQALYNESLMVLNNQINKPQCFGTPDWTVDPPVLKFKFPINGTAFSDCNNYFQITNQVGSGIFSDFSNVQYVNISGAITSTDPSAGMITYRPQVLYRFSCKYPMQYLLNNTELGRVSVNLAIKDNNGSFISTLSMELYKDEKYTERLSIPETGLNLKTKIYVAVKATNLTERFNVLLDRCYATTSPYPMQSTYYDLFIGCSRGAQTKVELNGMSQKAHFSFEAFRFVEHKNQTVSTFFLHCATRLCETPTCRSLLPVCGNKQNRKRREAQYMSNNTTVSSPPITVASQRTGGAPGYDASKGSGDSHTYFAPQGQYESYLASQGGSPKSSYSGPMMALTICIAIIII
ncbi:zona pellucida-like domain-containing protein 1 [Mugil cephalus]|uniref:zona pellucida-like domain-containing protein 1 n=1 Tax=Mugil cephalus TaxID=48193 RepID=UPI001FB6A5ED|nr:zona pellucida-like domain-containing protein 1 [Mugil cephalus]